MDQRQWIRTLIQGETRKALSGLQEQIKELKRRIQKLEDERDNRS